LDIDVDAILFVARTHHSTRGNSAQKTPRRSPTW
jgi:hypothetical protein